MVGCTRCRQALHKRATSKLLDRRVRQGDQAVPFAAGSLLYSTVNPLNMLRAALIFRSCSAQEFPSFNEVLRFEALGEFLIDRGQQSDGLGPAAGRDPVRGKIGGAPQLEGHRPDGARFGESLLQPLFSTQRLTCMEKNRCIDTLQFRPAPAFSLAFLDTR